MSAPFRLSDQAVDDLVAYTLDAFNELKAQIERKDLYIEKLERTVARQADELAGRGQS